MQPYKCCGQLEWSLNDSLEQSGPSAGGLWRKHKAFVAMVLWHEQWCILEFEPNATLIFSLANPQLSLHSLFVSQSSLLPSLTTHFLLNGQCQSRVFCLSQENARRHCELDNLKEIPRLCFEHNKTLWLRRHENKLQNKTPMLWFNLHSLATE